jgi:REP element-mobilizing transposase RayT
MTYPRLQIVDPAAAGFFHCVSRCVRRAFLCGQDAYSGRSYEHRKAWVEERLLELAECFAIGLYAYAVMSNHVHVVLQVDPQVARQWSDDEVAARWVRLFPVRMEGEINEDACREKVQRILGDPERLGELRYRLGSVSWFMRCLNEPIARQANREDGCTGRFWEGRFKCQALLDEQAVLACMAYVDLNPIRAKVAADLATSTHTSIQHRLREVESQDDTHAQRRELHPIAGMRREEPLSLRVLDYVALVDWSGRVVREGKRGAIAADAPPALAKLGLREFQWQSQMLGIESRYWRAVGTIESLVAKARALGQHWLKGGASRRQLA